MGGQTALNLAVALAEVRCRETRVAAFSVCALTLLRG
jgi:hypothetical protein